MGVSLPEDRSSSVGSPIHIECANGLREFLQGEFGKEEKSEVNKVSGSTRINKGGGFDGLCSNK